MDSSIAEFVRRPDLGRVGHSIKVRTNYFEITDLPFPKIYHYDIVIIPEVSPTSNRRIIQEAENSFSGVKAVFDGRRNVYAVRPFPFGDAHNLEVTMPENDMNNVGIMLPRVYKVIIRKVAEIDMREINRFLNGDCSISSNILTGIMALNVLIHHKPSKEHIKVGRIFYTNQGSQLLDGGMEVWQGYFQSIRPKPRKMMINIDLHATAFYERGSLIQLVVRILGKSTVEDLWRIQERDRTKLEKCLKNLKIFVVLRFSRHRFRISKLTNTSASSTTFEVNGQQIDIATYFFSTYGRRLQYPFLPCVVVRNETYLPIEICNVVEGQRYMRKLNERQMADMIEFTCQPPQIRTNTINQGIEILNYRQNEYIYQFGFQISNDMVITQARVLPTPTLYYHPASKEDTFIPKDGLWNLKNKKVATGATLGSWACAVFGSERDYPIGTIQNFIRELVNTCQVAGMNIPNRNPPIQHCNPQGGIENSLKQVWVRAGNSAKSNPQLILCILPNTGAPLYAEIKRVCDTVIGVATQCIQGKHMFSAKKQYCANVCLKINVKLGGMNSFIDPSQMPFITQRPTIIMGASVIHPAPGEQNTGRSSIAAVTASVDAKAFRYFAAIRIQHGKQVVIDDLAEIIKELLKAFYQTCGRKPERILFYRDGISENQFLIVRENVIKAINAACKSLDEKYKPTITFVVVQKRHHTRFFPIDTRRDGDRTGNCPSGTVVDTTVVHPFEFDFYLLSHPSLQGISRPAHYHVLYDENGFNADSLQTLTYNLCYNFARCTRAVSIVPPVYYARLVCRRARFHVSGENWSNRDTLEEFVKRPGLDKLGRPIRLRINYFEITDFPFNNVYHYEIVILPEVPPTLNRKIFRMSDVTMPEDNTNNVDRRPPRIFKIRIKKVAEIHMEEINMFLDRRGLMTLNVLTGIMALNVLIHHMPSMMLKRRGEYFNMMINIDFHATAFYESSSLTRIVKKVLNKRTIEELRDISERDRLKIENFLKNLKIYATHDENALNRRFRISKVTNTSDSNTTTFDDNGNQTDVASYFQRKYNMQLQHPFLPCIVIREETYLPLEVCNVVETRQIQYDCQPSQSRANKINQGIGILNYQQNEYYMQRFDFRVSNEVAITQARIFPAPNYRIRKLPLVQQLGSWACTVFGSENDFPMSAIQKFIRELQVWLKAGNDAKAQPQLILCILPNTGVSLYDAEIKRVGDTVTGVVTLCIQSRNMFAIKKQYCVNVYLKINAKLGGMNSFINPSQLLFVSESPTIILGASVIHPVPGDTSRPSIAAVAASIDAMASRYVASIRVQQEVISHLADMTK
ncbi:5802_t:CDS:10 [Rhizophagus irregularis]|nr:5802_t:CDS:10 [Rhizophagus irregularis]